MLRVPISHAIKSARRAGALSESASLYDGRAMLASSWILDKNVRKYGDGDSSGASAMMALAALAAAGIGGGTRCYYVLCLIFSCRWSSVGLCGSSFLHSLMFMYSKLMCVVEYLGRTGQLSCFGFVRGFLAPRLRTTESRGRALCYDRA